MSDTATKTIELVITPMDAMALLDALETRRRVVGDLTVDQAILVQRLRRKLNEAS